jgi:hypothetical protein
VKQEHNYGCILKSQIEESDMKRNVAIALAMAASTMGSQLPSPVLAQEWIPGEAEPSQRDELLPPRIDRLGVRATLLHPGMPARDVERIMGAPAQVDSSGSEGSDVRVLRYPAEPIATAVTLTDDILSGVALDIASIDDPTLPNFSRAASLGMSRSVVLRMLGVPVEDRLRDGYGMTAEQMIFERPGGPDVSVFLVNGRVVTKKVGRSFPADILGFALPLAPDPADNEIDDVADGPQQQSVQVGMKASKLPTLFGAPKLQVAYTFKGRPAEYAIYETSPGKSFGRFTSIDGILTEFADGGHTPLSQILDGR